jgi:hypothetical protein
MPATKGQGTNLAQDMAIISTYGRRYSLTGALGVGTNDEDMDGRLPEQAGPPITDAQALELHALIVETESDMAGFLRWAGVDELESLPASKLRQAKTLLAKKAAQS